MNMRNIYILWGLLACMAFTSCYEEDTLTPTEGGVELRFKVPQGNNSWSSGSRLLSNLSGTPKACLS